MNVGERLASINQELVQLSRESSGISGKSSKDQVRAFLNRIESVERQINEIHDDFGSLHDKGITDLHHLNGEYVKLRGQLSNLSGKIDAFATGKEMKRGSIQEQTVRVLAATQTLISDVNKHQKNITNAIREKMVHGAGASLSVPGDDSSASRRRSVSAPETSASTPAEGRGRERRHSIQSRRTSSPTRSGSSSSSSSHAVSPRPVRIETRSNSEEINTKLAALGAYLRHLDDKGDEALNAEGLFRISPSQDKAGAVAATIAKGADVPAETPVHVFALLVKTTTKALMKESGVTGQSVVVSRALEIANSPSMSPVEKQEAMKQLFATFSEAQRAGLTAIFEFLTKVEANSKVNKMHESNLAIVFAPNIFPTDDLAKDPMQGLALSNQSQDAFKILFNAYKADPDDPVFADRTIRFQSDNPDR